MLSEITYSQFSYASRSGKPAKVLSRLWRRWQNALIDEGKLTVIGKGGVILTW